MVPQRTLWLGGQLGLLATAAFFAASSVNAMISMRLLPPLPAEMPAAPAASGSAGTPPLARYSAITERDVFNPPRAVEARAVESAPTASPLNAKLLGTAPGEGIDSYAILEDGASRKQDLYRIGDRFQDRTLAKVAWDHVVFRAGEREETLKLADPASRPGPAAPTEAASIDGTGIRSLSETAYQIDRAEVDKAMENLNQIFTQVRAVPHFQDGKAAGFRLFAIRRDSIFEKLGLKNGDIVSRINGNELTDPARAMSLLQELRGEGSVSVEVTRNRAPTTMSYEIR